MGKKHKAKKRESSDGKPDRIKLPKRIGKVKIPKELRQSGERLIESGIEALRDAATREIAAAGIAAIVANATRERPAAAAPRPSPAPRAAPVEATIIDRHDGATIDGTPIDAARIDPDALLNTIGQAASQALRDLLGATRR